VIAEIRNSWTPHTCAVRAAVGAERSQALLKLIAERRSVDRW
jgi:hypothetical protein